MELSAIQEGIKVVGIGRRGSKPLEPEHIDAIIEELKQVESPSAVEGAFIAALLNKGLTHDEKRIIQVVGDPLVYLTKGTTGDIRSLCQLLLEGKELNKYQAIVIGNYILSPDSSEAVCGLVASALRVRYETLDEYTGILECIHSTFNPAFTARPPKGKPIVQIAEPFNGFNKTNLVTPILADFVQSLGYRVVTLTGRNSGPKNGNNVQDVAKKLYGRFIKTPLDLTDDIIPFGNYVDQVHISAAMDRWVDIRRQIIKRPFMATLERVINPFKADILIASAFHPPYGEKMLDIAEYAGFKKIIIVRNGLEGGTTFALKRPTKVLISTKGQRREIEFDAEKELNITVPVEEKIVPPSLEKNVELITRYKEKKATGYDLFDWRIDAMKKCIGELCGKS